MHGRTHAHVHSQCDVDTRDTQKEIGALAVTLRDARTCVAGPEVSVHRQTPATDRATSWRLQTQTGDRATSWRPTDTDW